MSYPDKDQMNRCHACGMLCDGDTCDEVCTAVLDDEWQEVDIDAKEEDSND